MAERSLNELARRSRSTLLPGVKGPRCFRHALRLPDLAPDLPLALPHLHRPQAALLASTRSVSMSIAPFPTLDGRSAHVDAADEGLDRGRLADFPVRLRRIGARSPRRERHSAAGHATARACPCRLNFLTIFSQRTSRQVAGGRLFFSISFLSSCHGLVSFSASLCVSEAPLLGRRPTT